MGNNQPGSNPNTITSLYPGIIAKLQNRTDITLDQASIWVKRALQNLTESEIFYELQREGPLVTIGVGLGWKGSNYVYPVSMFLNPGDDYTLSEDPVIILASTVGGTYSSYALINNSVTYPMDYMTPKAIQPLLGISGGISFKYSRRGRNYWFGTQPGQNYQVYLPYQVRYPFAPNLPDTQLFIPQSWEEVVEYSAAMRGAEERRWPDMVKDLKIILYGDPKMPDQPGLLKAMKLQIERDENKSTRQLIPVVQRY